MRESVDEWIEYIGETFWGPTPQQMLRRSQLKIRETERKLERERSRLRKQESDLVTRLRTAAAGSATKSELENLALTVARCRRGTHKIDKMQLQLTGVSQVRTVHVNWPKLALGAERVVFGCVWATNAVFCVQDLLSTDVTTSLADVIRSVNVSLGNLNGMFGGTTGMGREMLTFQRERDKLVMMNESLDDTLGDAEETEDAETTLASLAEELDLKLAFDLPVPVGARRGLPHKEEEEEDDKHKDMIRRFHVLMGRGGDDDASLPPPPSNPPSHPPSDPPVAVTR